MKPLAVRRILLWCSDATDFFYGEGQHVRILIAEDDLTSRNCLNKYLSQYGECDLTVDGLETVDAFLIALKDETPYELICLDIMMP